MLHFSGIVAIMRTQLSVARQPASGVELLILGTDTHDETHDKINNIATSRADNGVSGVDSRNFRPQPRPPTRLPLDELVSILPRVSNLFKKASIVLAPRDFHFETQLTALREEAVAARSELLAWYSAQSTTSRPATVERFTRPYTLLFPDVKGLSCNTLRADAYTDRKESQSTILVDVSTHLLTREAELMANMWNTYRQCQIHLADLICRINDSLTVDSRESSGKRECRKLQSEIGDCIDDICASIPFMLGGDTIRHCKPKGALWELPKPPMLLGGLSMQWRLFTIATLESAPHVSKDHARNVLLWIGEALGIGQARVLANVYIHPTSAVRRPADVPQMQENPRGGITAKGDALSWAGFLV